MPNISANISAPNLIMSDRMFRCFSKLIMVELGIKMPPSKKTMLQGRLQKRLRLLGMKSFDEYGDYIFSTEGKRHELIEMLDLVTTNKTDFFREPRHFEYLTQTALPTLIDRWNDGVEKRINVWSAGCSNGAEPYTLAMVMSEFKKKLERFDFSIYATDVCTQVLDKATKAIYSENEIEPVPIKFKKKYLMKSKSPSNHQVRIVPELRAKVEYNNLNLMNMEYPIQIPMDIIFCRNVIIYFDKSTQEAVLRRLCRHLKTDGYLFMGHSETLNGFTLPLRQVITTVYRKISTHI